MEFIYLYISQWIALLILLGYLNFLKGGNLIKYSDGLAIALAVEAFT